jgi:CheY-like chemotaxis protein
MRDRAAGRRCYGWGAMASHPLLLVEDDQDTRDAIQCLLETEGLDVVTAANGRDALAQLDAGLEPCLIVLDLYMPVMDGFGFRRMQLTRAEWARVPVLLYSNGHEARRAARELGIEMHLAKFDLGELAEVAVEHCAAWRRQHARDERA